MLKVMEIVMVMVIVMVALVHVSLSSAGAADRDQGAAPQTKKESVTLRQELLARMDTVEESMHIVLHAREQASRLASQLSSLLSALGATRIEQRIVDVVPDDNQVRYYHSSDSMAGRVVGEALGLVFDDVEVRDFAGYEPSPAKGLIEIWLH